MKSTVIFDLDGLLIDSEIISYQLYCDLTQKYGQYISKEAYIHGYSGKTAIDNMQRLIEEYHLPVAMEEGLAFTSWKEKEYFRKGVPLKRGARELLSYLKRRQYKIVLASSSSRKRAVGDVKRGKPCPDIFQKACEYAGELPENCLVLEDSEAGIQAAYSAGIDVICIPDMKAPGKGLRKMETAELPSLNEVIFWLEKMQEEELAI